MNEEQLPWIAAVALALAGAVTALAKRRNGRRKMPHDDDKLVGTLSTISTRLNEVSTQVTEVRRDLEPIKRHVEAIIILKAKIEELTRIVEALRPARREPE